MNIELKRECHEYWNNRASGYSDVNKEELVGVQRQKWADVLNREIGFVFKDRNREEIKVLDIGCGPGFLPIVLSENGYEVTGVDYSEDMLACARENMRKCGVHATLCQGDAMKLDFDDASFDVIVSRNLTWNLQDVEDAYAEWIRVLKPEGLLLVFDANWYHYLRDENSRKAYDIDRQNVAENGFGDYNIGENFDIMEEIADRLPMTGVNRPIWDRGVLVNYGMENVDYIENIGSEVYSDKEKINYKSTPLFMIKAKRGK